MDTAGWLDDLRRNDAVLADALNANVVAIHPFVIGELACGLLKSRGPVLGLLRSLARLAQLPTKRSWISLSAIG